MTVDPAIVAAVDERLDRLVSLDIGGRGVEHLYAAARARQGRPLVGAAADAQLAGWGDRLRDDGVGLPGLDLG